MMEQRLTLVAILPARSADGHVMALYSCKCGGSLVARRSRVANGYTRSCGCLARESKPGLSHGGHGSPTYSSWCAMKQRCLNPNSKDFARWGGAGIGICDEWAANFDAFLSDMGPRPAGTTLDRIDPGKGYEPANCRWATPQKQALNRRDVVQIHVDGRTMPLAEYAREIGISRGAAHLRLRRGKLDGASHV